MNFEFKLMNIEYLREIKEWRYDGFIKAIYTKPYFDNYEEGMAIIKGPDNCDGYAVFYNNNLFGLFEYYILEEYIEIGLALNPIYVGKGYSKDFITSGIIFFINHYDFNYEYIVLNVDKENISAYKAYLNAGFKEIKEKNNEVEMRYFL
ncbi:MAG: GNAT family N-acetyltransferase [Candidatus Izimaplasma sp.]|nr:GNAT family N-acetyltransferase [Candidatus Izimaplasma bacterium]